MRVILLTVHYELITYPLPVIITRHIQILHLMEAMMQTQETTQ